MVILKIFYYLKLLLLLLKKQTSPNPFVSVVFRSLATFQQSCNRNIL